MDEILARYPTTLKLTFGSIALGIVVGVIVGIISAVRQYSLLDKIGTFISLFGVSAPSFWIAMMLVLVFSVKLNLLPATGEPHPGLLGAASGDSGAAMRRIYHAYDPLEHAGGYPPGLYPYSQGQGPVGIQNRHKPRLPQCPGADYYHHWHPDLRIF